jgi:hypothetical protein
MRQCMARYDFGATRRLQFSRDMCQSLYSPKGTHEGTPLKNLWREFKTRVATCAQRTELRLQLPHTKCV